MIITNEKDLISREVELVNDESEFIDIIKELEIELKKSSVPGVGLAAPQININKAVAIIRVPATQYNKAVSIDLINPKLISGEGLVFFDEGCLSFPGQSARTIRYEQITVETLVNYNNESNNVNDGRYIKNLNIQSSLWEKRNICLSDFEAIICQHETSHLNNLTMFNFAPIEVNRNDKCPCGSNLKNKKCHNYSYYNSNLKKLFNPGYRSV